MRLPVLHDNNGFTLIEFLVALVIMTVGLLGLLQSVNIAISSNAGNKMRGNAQLIADQVLGTQRVIPFSAILTKNSSARIPVNTAFINYSINRIVSSATATTKSVNIIVSWREKGVKKQHDLSTLITDMPTLNQ